MATDDKVVSTENSGQSPPTKSIFVVSPPPPSIIPSEIPPDTAPKDSPSPSKNSIQHIIEPSAPASASMLPPQQPHSQDLPSTHSQERSNPPPPSSSSHPPLPDPSSHHDHYRRASHSALANPDPNMNGVYTNSQQPHHQQPYYPAPPGPSPMPYAPHPHYYPQPPYPPPNPNFAHPYAVAYHPNIPPHPRLSVSSSAASSPVPLPSHIASPTNPSPDSPSTAPSPNVPKRKRKSDAAPGKDKPTAAKANEGATNGSGQGVASASTQDSDKEKHKRTKTQRACDPCRRKKIRCDVLVDSDPPLCAHCRQYGFECTFFLPITETRFKKRKVEEEEAAKSPSAARNAQGQAGPLPDGKRPQSNRPGPHPGVSTQQDDDASRGAGAVRVYGATSMSYILHSSTSMPKFDSFDLRYHQTWRVSKTGEGFIIQESEDLHPPSPSGASPDAQAPSANGPPPIHLERQILERLINYYFRNIAPVFPVITEAEFLDSGGGSGDQGGHDVDANGRQRSNSSSATAPRKGPPPVLLYAICAMAATARDVPLQVFESLRVILNTVIRSEDVLSHGTIPNIQALLIIGMTGEPNGKLASRSMSAAWLRVGAAIRMAQDMGLHRAEAVKTNIQLRRRLWAACVISDRWYGLTLGLPFIVDVHDCDARLPGPDHSLPADSQDARSLQFMGEFVKLSILVGKVSKTIYSPTGLLYTTDEDIERLLSEIDNFHANIPYELVFRGPDSIQPAGLLHLFYTCTCMMFWRVFMRMSYTCPAHLKFRLTVPRWTALVQASTESITWLDRHENLYDSWIFVAYAVTSCALIQYHTWVRRKDTNAQDSLRQLRDCVKRWQNAIEPGHMNTRLKTSEIICLLYEATHSPVPGNLFPSNPTAGVMSRPPGVAKDLVFRKDPTRPGGGLYIATQKTAAELGGQLPPGTVVLPDDAQGESYTTPDGGPSGNMVGIGTITSSPTTGSSSVSEPSPLVVNMTPFGESRSSSTGGLSNLNPNINAARYDGTFGVQVLNLLDQPTNPGVIESQAVADNGLLESMPGSIFDWDQWDTFFSRFQFPVEPGMDAFGGNPHAGGLAYGQPGGYPPPGPNFSNGGSG